MKRFILLMSLFVRGAAAGEEPEIFRSGPREVVLLELYTSEGCNSCPPAEQWLAGNLRSPHLWRRFVPVAFHVDYWDRLGWKDPLSREQFSQRQWLYGALWNARSVYTPEFAVQGREWRDWRKEGVPLSEADVGVLEARREGRTFRVAFQPSTSARAESGYELHAALLGCGMSSKVEAGENGGKTLVHEFAALQLVDEPMERVDDRFEGVVTLDAEAPLPATRRAVAIWVGRVGDPSPVQAVGGFLR